MLWQGATQGSDATLETTMLLGILLKIGGLLRVGFGETGASIITSQLNDRRELDPLSPGRCTQGVFVYFAIPELPKIAARLHEALPLFLNRLAAVVHGVTVQHGGEVCANDAHGFLLLWRLPDEDTDPVTGLPIPESSVSGQTATSSHGQTTLRRRVNFATTDDAAEQGGTPPTSASPAARHTHSAAAQTSASPTPQPQPLPYTRVAVAEDPSGLDPAVSVRQRVCDLALMSSLKTLVHIRRTCSSWLQDMPRMNNLFAELWPDFVPRVAVGLHVGTAVQAAVGSDRKIDALHLSSDIQYCGRLAHIASGIGVPVIFTKEFREALSAPASQCCRWLGRYRIRSVHPSPTSVATYDVKLRINLTRRYSDPPAHQSEHEADPASGAGPGQDGARVGGASASVPVDLYTYDTALSLDYSSTATTTTPMRGSDKASRDTLTPYFSTHSMQVGSPRKRTARHSFGHTHSLGGPMGLAAVGGGGLGGRPRSPTPYSAIGNRGWAVGSPRRRQLRRGVSAGVMMEQQQLAAGGMVEGDGVAALASGVGTDGGSTPGSGTVQSQTLGSGPLLSRPPPLRKALSSHPGRGSGSGIPIAGGGTAISGGGIAIRGRRASASGRQVSMTPTSTASPSADLDGLAGRMAGSTASISPSNAEPNGRRSGSSGGVEAVEWAITSPRAHQSGNATASQGSGGVAESDSPNDHTHDTGTARGQGSASHTANPLVTGDAASPTPILPRPPLSASHRRARRGLRVATHADGEAGKDEDAATGESGAASVARSASPRGQGGRMRGVSPVGHVIGVPGSAEDTSPVWLEPMEYSASSWQLDPELQRLRSRWPADRRSKFHSAMQQIFADDRQTCSMGAVGTAQGMTASSAPWSLLVAASEVREAGLPERWSEAERLLEELHRVVGTTGDDASISFMLQCLDALWDRHGPISNHERFEFSGSFVIDA